MTAALDDRPTRAVNLALGLVLLFAVFLRFSYNDVEQYSPADESHYLRDTRILADGGVTAYPSIVDGFLGDPGRRVFPSPLRWGYLGVAAFFCKVTGDVSFRGLATLSTIAGVLSVLVTYLVGAELFPRVAALFAAALVATSPLQLALGRRALADELFCLAFLAALWMMLRVVRARDLRARLAWGLGWVAMTTLTIAVKEQFLLVYPALLLFFWLRGGRRLTPRLVVLWMLPPVLFASVFFVLAGSVVKFFRIAWIITSEMGAPYAFQYQSGPPHRLLIDFLAIAPFVTIAALVAAGLLALRRESVAEGDTHLWLLVGGILLVHALLPSKNLRYLIEVDPLVRLLVASFVWREVLSRGLGLPTALAVLVVNGAVEWITFVQIFIRAGVYDPVTEGVLRALNMLSR